MEIDFLENWIGKKILFIKFWNNVNQEKNFFITPIPNLENQSFLETFKIDNLSIKKLPKIMFLVIFNEINYHENTKSKCQEEF